MEHLHTTICALATPPGEGGIATVRVSGPDAYGIVGKIFEPVRQGKSVADAKGYTAMLGHYLLHGAEMDECVALFFRAPHSYTGEDVIELSVHGGTAMADGLLEALITAGCAPAGPGEFTRRALENGRMSLTQAEAVMEVIAANGRQGAALAKSALDGRLAKRIGKIQTALQTLNAHLTAWVDYPEEDVPELSDAAFVGTLTEQKAALDALISGYSAGAVLRHGVDCVLLGRPNVGKSTLLNLLAGFDRAIVTPVAGTTRDIVEQAVQLGSVRLNLFDTAGVREVGADGDAIEAEGGEKPVEFEAVTALAFLWFAREKCDLVVLETGLGGRCDATNVVPHKLVAAITKIGYDHMAVLGNTLPEIAAEKAGVIKRGTSLVLESQEAEVMTVFEAKVREEGITDFRLIDPLEIKEQTYRDGRQYFSFGAYRDLSMRMLGVHQYENAVAALLGAEAFFGRHTEWICGGTKEREEGIRRVVRQGIAKTVWKGRMEILSEKPFLLVDGAHNSNGVEALKESLISLFPGEKFHFIMGVMADKDYEKMIGKLLPLAIDFTTCTVECERALQADALADCIRRKGIAAASADDFASCFQRGRLDETHRTVAFGSLYFIGEIEALFEAK